ncbi:hypothetical protein EYF80_046226 [Liparis tanakae]|uniref:Uncharacterized protein n=1 Tax=Liparis tanakae TaxID=230148 RepID=A0A4Z2FS24_9TELE|nr:hypothetical protein EYF80_046226 [Liparis tanakae]
MAKQRRVMRGRSQTERSNSSVLSFHVWSERPLLSLLTAGLQSSSVPWKSPALTWTWRGKTILNGLDTSHTHVWTCCRGKEREEEARLGVSERH